MAPTIGVYMSTYEGPRAEQLARTLHSIRQQRLIEGDRVLVIGDGHVPGAADIVASYGFEYEERPRRSPDEWGSGQRNYAIERLRGTVDLVTCQDHDDVFAPRAFEAVRAAHLDRHLVMTRAYQRWRTTQELLWRVPKWDEPLAGPEDEHNKAFTGHCPFMPGREPVLPHYGIAYNGDQEYVQACRLLFWNRVVWKDAVTTVCRPDSYLGWRLQPWEVRTPAQVEALRQVRNECAPYMTGDQSAIGPERQARWWNELVDHSAAWFYLFTERHFGPEREPAPDDYVGFLALRLRNGTMCPTYGVRKGHRGRGLGLEIVQYSIVAAQGPLLGDALASNESALALYRKLGWTLTDRGDGTVEIAYAWPPAFLDRKDNL